MRSDAYYGQLSMAADEENNLVMQLTGRLEEVSHFALSGSRSPTWSSASSL